MTGEEETTQIAWMLSYVQRGIVKAWKDNLLDELAKGESEIEIAENLFTKIRNKFGKTMEAKRKVEQLRTIEQRGRLYDKYVSLKRLPGRTAMREDLLSRNSREN